MVLFDYIDSIIGVDKMFCRKCGKEINDDAKFCSGCGASNDSNNVNTFNIPNNMNNPNLVQNRPFKRRKGCSGCLVGVIVFIGLMAFGAVMVQFQSDRIQQSVSGVNDKSEYITLEKFNRISTNMTYDEVVEIIGSSGTVSSDVTSGGYNIKIITWYGNGFAGSNANVTFTNGKVTGKAQAGLK